MRLVLASASPRRARLLAEAGYAFDVVPADIDERRLDDEAPATYVRRLAAAKAGAVAPGYPGRVVVGADTVVVIDGLVLGKPSDAADAAGMLGRLAGRRHVVLTGVSLVRDAQSVDAVERTAVTFSSLDADRIRWYVGTGEPDDKAGAYAAQGIGSRFVERVEGSYTNVVGLPISIVGRLLDRLDGPVPPDGPVEARVHDKKVGDLAVGVLSER